MPGLASFFEAAFGNTEGYMCVASRKTGGKFTERFFSYPEGVESAIVFSKTKASIENVYFCPQLLTEKRRAKTNVDMVSSIWADLDDCPPNLLKVEPTLVLETSPHRYQAIWTLNNPIPGEYNHKYDDSGIAPQVKILTWNDIAYDIEAFDVYPQVSGYEYLDVEFPE